ncbi:hypothetical protein EBA21_05840 [Xanthomonas oryzae pv. oryzae]|nr:hypothetical protein EBA21_05840 [Xanthomonas oryzae pv. oryzae]
MLRLPNPDSPIPTPQSRLPNPDSPIPTPQSRLPNPRFTPTRAPPASPASQSIAPARRQSV